LLRLGARQFSFQTLSFRLSPTSMQLCPTSCGSAGSTDAEIAVDAVVQLHRCVCHQLARPKFTFTITSILLWVTSVRLC
jgi:hypothetical protein